MAATESNESLNQLASNLRYYVIRNAIRSALCYTLRVPHTRAEIYFLHFFFWLSRDAVKSGKERVLNTRGCNVILKIRARVQSLGAGSRSVAFVTLVAKTREMQRAAV